MVTGQLPPEWYTLRNIEEGEKDTHKHHKRDKQKKKNSQTKTSLATSSEDAEINRPRRSRTARGANKISQTQQAKTTEPKYSILLSPLGQGWRIHRRWGRNQTRMTSETSQTISYQYSPSTFGMYPESHPNTPTQSVPPRDPLVLPAAEAATSHKAHFHSRRENGVIMSPAPVQEVPHGLLSHSSTPKNSCLELKCSSCSAQQSRWYTYGCIPQSRFLVLIQVDLSHQQVYEEK